MVYFSPPAREVRQVEENWVRKRMGVLFRVGGTKNTPDMQCHVGRRHLDHVPFQKSPGTDAEDLIQEAEKWDLAPKPASLWWTSTYDSEEKIDLSVSKTGRHRFPFEENLRILGCTMNRQGKTHECPGSKDVPWRAKCRRMVEHVYSVFCFGSENWSWSQKTVDRSTGWETKARSRLFRCKNVVIAVF